MTSLKWSARADSIRLESGRQLASLSAVRSAPGGCCRVRDPVNIVAPISARHPFETAGLMGSTAQRAVSADMLVPELQPLDNQDMIDTLSECGASADLSS